MCNPPSSFSHLSIFPPLPLPLSTIQNITETPSHPTIKISNDNDESQHTTTSHDQLAEENQREGGEEGQDAGQSGTATDQETVAQLLKRVQMCVCEVSVLRRVAGSKCMYLSSSSLLHLPPSSYLQGPYVYELFSIMIHSGNAIGGHYYAYIK